MVGLFNSAKIGGRFGIVSAAMVGAAVSGAAASARATAPLYDPVILNIGISCQWQQNCQKRQLKAMLAANRFIAGTNPPLWRIHMCNKNARRGQDRADWIGFNACIRNTSLQPPPPPQARRASKKRR